MSYDSSTGTNRAIETNPSGGAPPESSGIAAAAGITFLGNLTSRVLGLARQSVMSHVFGTAGSRSAFIAVSAVPKMIYEMLIGGMLSAALVPVLSEYADKEREEDLWHLVSILLSLATVIMAGIILLLELLAPLVADILVPGFSAELRTITTMLTRVISPVVLLFSASGIVTAVLYARKNFVYPAMGAAVYNAGMIMSVLFLERYIGVAALSVGVLLGGFLQLAVQIPGLRRMRLAFTFDWSHPALRRILRLYAPVALSLVISNIGIVIDRSLASRTAEEAITWMADATNFIQLPLGLVSMAISLAILPTLSRIDVSENLSAFTNTVSLGLRLVLVLIIPAAVGLLVLGQPIIALVSEHGEFVTFDTAQTSRALRYYLLGLPFAAIDLPLVFAFYSRKDTVTPVLVGIAGVLIYLVIGPVLAFVLQMGFLGLVIANSVQLTSHAIIMLILFRRRFGGIGGTRILRTTARALAASVVMGVCTHLAYRAVVTRLDVGRTLHEIILVGVPGVVGAITYLVGAAILQVEEIALICETVRNRLRRALVEAHPRE